MEAKKDQTLKKTNPVTVQIFDVNQHKVVTKVLDMCLRKSSASAGIFNSIDLVMSKYERPWSNCTALGIGNSPVYIRKHKAFGVQRGQSYLMGRRCLFSLGWQPF